MVHKKYIKRGNKVFGPYLYENYREKGVIKTRYLGVGGKKKTNKKLWVSLLIILGVVFLLVLFFSFSSLISQKKIFEKSSDFLGEIASFSPFKFLSKLFITISPINVFVNVTIKIPPIISGIPDEILVCENTVLNNYPFRVYYNYDLRSLTVYIDPTGPFGPFYINSNYRLNDSFGFLETDIISGLLVKEYICNDRLDCRGKKFDDQGWATWIEIIYASDGTFLGTTLAKTNITIIEANKPPKVDIGTKTIDLFTRGENSVFYFDAGAYLWANYEETPVGELVFNLFYQNGSISPFDISNRGVINITGNESLIDKGNISKVYNLTICVNDTGIKNPHKNISLCSGYGFYAYPVRDCENFSLTVTKQNRQPRITSYYPFNLSLSVAGTDILYFNATAYDPDWNLLDFYWYVDDIKKDRNESTLFDEFEYSFGCDIGGDHKVKVVVTDGLLNDSVEWNLSVRKVSCAPPIPPGGGGGGGRLYCEEKWGCNDWKQCENLNKLVKEGWVSKNTELLIEKRCEIFNYSEEFCGFQTRVCIDLNYCNTTINKPGDLRECYYTESPNCTDNIKNCHDGACEVLVDCGGPCIACPTCNDKTQNQGEEEIDCGGPCEPCKELPFKPILFKSIVSYSLIALLILVLVLVIKEVREYYLSKKRAEKESIRSRIKQEKRTYFYRIIFIVFIVLLLFLANVYITRITHLDVISGVSKIGEGALASYNFISNFIKSLGIFLVSGPITNENSRLIIWDDTDNLVRYTNCSAYCAQKNKPSSNLWTVYFYANYTDKITGSPLYPGGGCLIRFEDENHNYGGWESMTYDDGSKFFEYSKQFSYKRDYNFEVNCSYDLYSINGTDNFIITNTAPYIIKTAQGYVDLSGIGEGGVWQCYEDQACYYNFSANVSEDDSNDKLTFSYLPSGNTTLTNFEINSLTGVLLINITDSKFTSKSVWDNKKVELSVRDDDEVMDSAILLVNIVDINDAPFFVGLENKTFNSDDLFGYIVNITDEENNVPFKVNISFMSCDAPKRANCTLFAYAVDETQGTINISFVPTENDVGSYFINFSVMDNSSLGNKTTSVLVNFTVNLAVWNKSLSYNYTLTEDENKVINLSGMVVRENMTFSNGSSFPSFNLVSNGIINFTPIDEDVGFHEVEITASNEETSSFRIFNFTILNVNDEPLILPLEVRVKGSIMPVYVNKDSNISLYENLQYKISLFVQDDDFKITQKIFYSEELKINLTIEGPDISLFNFSSFGIVGSNQALYTAEFTPRNESIGSYSITINVTDNSNVSDVFRFNLTINELDYDIPNINYPNSSAEFNLEENVTSDLIFRANHTVGDNLIYRFYINDVLKNSINYYGDDRNLTWSFTPNFTEETYGETKNLTLVVLNPLFPELNTSMTWNLTINHTNAPPQLIREIGSPIIAPYNYAFEKDLKLYFYDIDHEDSHYNQNVSFIVSSNSSPSYITISQISENWTFVLSSSKFSPFSELLNITAYDLDENGENMSQVTSNNFIVEFIEPPTVQVPVPTPSGGGGGRSETIISLKIIIPGRISAYEHEKIQIPLSLVNSGKTSFNDLTLTSSAFKDGNLSKEVNTSLDKNYFKSLNPDQKEDLNLTVFFDTDKVGDYEILVNVTSKSPVYIDWGKIHINLQKINESHVREILIFTQEFIVKNPQCIEINEIVKEAEKLFGRGDYENAKIKSGQAIEACKKSISQPSVPKKKSSPFEIGLYLIIATLLAFVVGIAYYFFKRRKIQKMKNLQEIKLKAMREAKPST